MSINDVSNARCYCTFVSLVPPRSPKLGPRYLRIEVHRVVLYLVTRSHVRVQERSRGFGEAVLISW
jgi:hypothetical protein